MRCFIVTCLFATVLAVPQGYNYKPQQQYDIPVGLTNFNTNSQIATTTSKTQEGHGFLQQVINSGSLERVLPGQQATAHNTQPFSTAPNLSKFQPHAQQSFGINGAQEQQQAPPGLANFNTNSQIATTSKNQEGHGLLQEVINSGNLERVSPGQQTTAHNSQLFSTAPNFSKFQPNAQQNFGFNGAQQQQQAPLITNFEGQQHHFNGFQQQHPPSPSSGTVTKDIYVHVPPEDVQNQQYQQSALTAPPPRKHYRIVFIKAPSHNTNNAALRIQQAPTEEKTIIYVLTKKADPLDLQAALQEVQPKQPSKPEVYFIRYKTQEEAKHAQRAIQAQYEQLGGTSQISDEGIAPVTSVVGSLNGIQQQRSLDFPNGSVHSSSSSGSSSSSSAFNSNRGINNNGKYLPPITKL